MTNEVVMHQAQRKQLCIDFFLHMTILISTFNLYIGKKVHMYTVIGNVPYFHTLPGKIKERYGKMALPIHFLMS